VRLRVGRPTRPVSTKWHSFRHGTPALGKTAGTIVGEPFAAPEGAAFDSELAREILTPGEEATIPVSRSGAPILFLQTTGAVRLEGGNGQIVERSEGQFALLSGQVVARGAGDGALTFVVAAIGDATAAREPTPAGTPEAGAGREERQQAREAAAQGEEPSGTGGTRRNGRSVSALAVAVVAVEVRAVASRRLREQAARAGSRAPRRSPVVLMPTVPAGAPAGTPALEPTLEPNRPADTTADGTPTLVGITPSADERQCLRTRSG
jgi:hypothetical protein